jgi:hypothetical protein
MGQSLAAFSREHASLINLSFLQVVIFDPILKSPGVSLHFSTLEEVGLTVVRTDGLGVLDVGDIVSFSSLLGQPGLGSLRVHGLSHLLQV